MGNNFVKRYELHYQPKKIEVGEAVLDMHFGCLNFHAKCYKGSRAKLTITVKNKWSSWGKEYPCTALSYVCSRLSDGASSRLPKYRCRRCCLRPGHLHDWRLRCCGRVLGLRHVTTFGQFWLRGNN
jgi:hypothetical protein